MNSSELSACPSCKALLRADVYPALYKSLPVGLSGEALYMDKEASCFYHPRKKAVIPCSACGRFLCALCDVKFNGNHLCPACLEKGKTKRKIKGLRKVVPKLLIQRIFLEVVNARRCERISHMATTRKAGKKEPTRMIISLFILKKIQIEFWARVFNHL